MIDFKKFVLDNGLRLLVHEDTSTPLATVNVLYDVGAKDEDPERTGFAHLFEHLMFGGSANITDFETPLQEVGGENNAFTNTDLTNYYSTAAADNLETLLWLESDRMLSLAFTPESLEVQRSVVIEEFKQRYLNQPYGDLWLLLRPLCFKKHPYQWATIGKEIAHIEEATLQHVKDFFFKHYGPQNAILSVAGNVDPDEVYSLVKKWFGEIPARTKYQREIPAEPKQEEARVQRVERNVPLDCIYKAWHIGGRKSDDYYLGDLVSDLLSRGKSSRLYNRLVKERRLFSEVNAFISGEIETGLFIVSGKPASGVSLEEANAGIMQEIERLCTELVPAKELEKVKNKGEATRVFAEMNVLNKAMNLAFFELLGDAAEINQEGEKYSTITVEDVQQFCIRTFREENSSTLYYHAQA